MQLRLAEETASLKRWVVISEVGDVASNSVPTPTMPSGSDFDRIPKAMGVEAAADDSIGDLDVHVSEKRQKRLKYARSAVMGTKYSVLAILVAILIGQASHTKNHELQSVVHSFF